MSAPYVGSMSLMDALLDAVSEHMYLTEFPDDSEPYLWCGCGWRSDEFGGVGDAGRSIQIHLSNVLHAASVAPIAERIAKAWDEGYGKGIQVGESGLIAGTDRHMAAARNPYRSTP